MNYLLVICFILFLIVTIFLFIDIFIKYGREEEFKNDCMSINDAIDKIISEFPHSHRVEIISKLPEKYHYQYWINCFYEDSLFKYTKITNDLGYYPNIKQIDKKISRSINWFSIKIKVVDAFIEKIKKEEEEWKKFYRDLELDYNREDNADTIDPNSYGSNKDDGKTIVLEFGDEILSDIVDDLLKTRGKKKK